MEEIIIQTPYIGRIIFNTHMQKIKRPKRPRSAYMYFVKEYQKRLKKKTKNLTFEEASKLCAAKWKHLSDECKQKYKKLSQLDYQRYKKEIKKFTPAELRKMRKRRDPCAPPRPLSAYMWFCKHNWKKAAKCNLNFRDTMREMGRRWGCLDRKNREKYEAMAECDKMCYEVEMERYRARLRSKKC